jgi:hypothetical protein
MAKTRSCPKIPEGLFVPLHQLNERVVGCTCWPLRNRAVERATYLSFPLEYHRPSRPSKYSPSRSVAAQACRRVAVVSSLNRLNRNGASFPISGDLRTAPS